MGATVHYELKDLRLFKAIVEAENLSTGAAAMHMTASSASYRLKNLEYSVGSALFLRTPKGMKLTPAGEVLARHARKLLTDVDVMHAELSDYSRNLRGSVRLLANSSSLNGFIIPSLARYLAANASINVDLLEKDSLSIVQDIQEGVADIGILAGNPPFAGLCSRLYAIERLVCAVAPDHPLATRSSVSFEQLLEHDFVSIDRNSSNFTFLSNRARLAGKPLNVRVHVHDFSSVLYMVEAGVGVALVPASIIKNRVRDQRIVRIAISDAWADRSLHLITREVPDQPELVSEFSEILLNDPQVASSRAEA